MISPPKKIIAVFGDRGGGACLTHISGIVLSCYQNHHGMTLGSEYPWSLAFALPTTITTMSKHSGGCPGRDFCSSTPHVGIGNPAAWGAEGCLGMSKDVRNTEGYAVKKMSTVGR